MSRVELAELLGVKTLRAVGKGMVRVVVNLDHQGVRARGNGGPGHGAHFFANARGVAGIDQHRQMGEFFQHGNGRQIQGVAGIGFKGADAALAQNDPVVSLGHDVLGRHQPFLDGGGQAPFEHHGFSHPAHAFQQLEILHVRAPTCTASTYFIMRSAGRAT